MGTHAYAVLQVRHVHGVQLVQLKNPWSRVRWKGAYSAADTRRWTAELRATLGYDPSGAARHDNGVFWIDYASLLKYFPGIFLNWNPRLFVRAAVRTPAPPIERRRGPWESPALLALIEPRRTSRSRAHGTRRAAPPRRPSCLGLPLGRRTTRRTTASGRSVRRPARTTR